MSPMMPRQSPDDAPSIPPKGGGVCFCVLISLMGLIGLMGLISLMRKPFSPPPSGRGREGLVIWPILVGNMAHIGE